MASSKESKEPSMFTQPWGVTWRKALVSLPRLVPDAALRITSPEGPQPVIIRIPSRGKHQIPLYVFIPPIVTNSISLNKHPRAISLPVLLDFHGGSFVLGSCQEQAPFCSQLCRDLTCLAISVDYQLGPYSKFPAAVEDAEDVLHALITPGKPGHRELRTAINRSLTSSDHHPHNETQPQQIITIDPTRIAISGFSSGGNLALNLALSVPPTPPFLSHAWPSPFPPDYPEKIPFLLFYPSFDARQLPHERPLPPGLDPPKGLLASLRLEAELMPTYLPRHMAAHPRASPGLVDVRDALHAQAKMLLVLPEFDSLAEQSRVWIERVQREEREGDLEVVEVKGVGHGWTQFPDGWVDEVGRRRKGEVLGRAVAFVRECWGE